MYVKGAGVGAIPVLVSELFTISIFVLALRYGFRSIHPTDHIFLVIALLGLIPWFITQDPAVSVVITIAIDAVSFVPTIRKSYHFPRTEYVALFGANVVRHVLILFSLEAYNIATTLHSIAMILLNTGMTLLLLLRKRELPEI
ncbi:hypothetical protein EBR66_03680 [bacterium]|nr:hypothetical protein [bacterium]